MLVKGKEKEAKRKKKLTTERPPGQTALPGLENAEDKTRASKRHELALRFKAKKKKRSYRQEDLKN